MEGDEAEVFDFVDEYLRDRAVGAEHPLSHYLLRFPGHEEAVSREFLALGAEAEAPSEDVEDGEQRVGPYRLLSLLGRGGQGAVWLAEDARIARRVALKVLPPSFAALSRERRERLRREAEVVSRLDHPGICPVHEAEIDREPPYIAMRFVEGGTLGEAIASARAPDGDAQPALPLPPRDRAQLVRVLAFFERAARALHAAHEAGVVHRDVKPGNIMVTREGEPVVLDFGQARDERSELGDLTLSGEVFGTPAYMSPEQVSGGQVDRRTDVWSLGASLFEALTLERAFDAPSVPGTLEAIVTRTPARPSARNASLASEVDAVVETALDKDQARRYPSALELAEDLRRIREYEPVRARPAGPWLRLRRWMRRHPALALANAAIVLSLSIGLSYSLHLLAREGRALDYAVGRHLAERTIDQLEQDPSAALALGIEAVELAPNYLTRKALYAALDACRLRSQLDGEGARRLLALALDPGAPRVIAALDDGSLRSYDRESGRELTRVRAHEGAVRALAMHPSGARVVTAGDDGALRIWSHPALELIGERHPPDGPPTSLAIDGSGARVAVAMGASWSWYELDGADAREGLRAEGLACGRVRFTPDGRRVLSAQAAPHLSDGSPPEALALWDVDSGRELHRLRAPGAPILCSAISSDGELLAAGSQDGSLRFWSVLTGEPVREALALEGPVTCVAFAPDARRLAITLDEPARACALLLDLVTGESLELQGHDGGPVVHAAFSPDGSELATAGSDMSVRIWRVRDGAARAVLRGFIQPLEVLWSADARRLITLNNAPWADVWYGAHLPDMVVLAGHTDAVSWADFAPEGERAITASRDGTARIWRLPSASASGDVAGELMTVLAGHVGPVTRALFSPDGRTVCTLSEDGTARLWDADTGSERSILVQHEAPLVAASFSQDGSRLCVLSADGLAWGIDPSRPESAQQLESGAKPATCAAFSPSGQVLALGDELGLLSTWTWESEFPFERQDIRPVCEAAILDLAFDARGETLALACADARVRFVELAAGQPARAELPIFPPRIVDWSADGTRLLVTGGRGRGAFRLQDLEADVMVRPEVYHLRPITAASFSPDGALVVTASVDGSAYVRDAINGKPYVHLALHAGPVLHAAFAPSGCPPRVITASADGTARIWPLDPLGAARARQPRGLRDWEVARERRLAKPLPYR